MTTRIHWVGAAVLLAAAVVAGTWALRHRRVEAGERGPAPAPARIERNGAGETVLTLDRETRERAGIREETLTAAEADPEVMAYGRLQEDPAAVFVLRAPVAGTLREAEGRSWPAVGDTVADGAVAGLVEPRLTPAERTAMTERLAAARAEAASAQAAVAAAKAAYERARTLHADNQNVSTRAVQEAEARLLSEQARAAGAAETVGLLGAAVAGPATTPLRLSRGGQVVEVLAQPGEAVEGGQPLLRVVRFEKLLARVEAPAGEPVLPGAATARVVVLGHEGQPLAAERVAVGAAIEPGTPGQTFLFRVHAGSLPLRPGMAVTAYLRAPGPRRQGVIVPRSGVVHAEGKFWVYVRASEGALARRAVTLERELGRGWFVTAGLRPGDRVVAEGAQALLSEEYKSQVRSEEDEAR